MHTPEQLAEIFTYTPENGHLRWKKTTSQKSKIGELAGTKRHDGRVIVCVEGKRYRSYRVAWAIMTGKWPDGEIDHINRDCTDDRWCNLREATRLQNMANLGIPKRNRSGHKGVSWHKAAGKWQAHIKSNNANYYLGLFERVEDAARAYREAAERLNGEFSAH